MQNIVFNNGTLTDWKNNSGSIVSWQNNSSINVAWETYNSIYSVRMADFVKVTTGDATYRFSTAPTSMTIPAVDPEPFSGLGVLVNIGDVTRDIKSTANETSITLVGLDTSILGWVLGQGIKGSKIEMWHGFFNANNELIQSGGVGGLYKFFTGYVNSFQISEQWIEEARSYTGVVSVNASSIQIILQNSVSGRFTNNNAWTYFNPTDTSMERVGFIETINYAFGADGVPTVASTTQLGTKTTKVPTEL